MIALPSDAVIERKIFKMGMKRCRRCPIGIAGNVLVSFSSLE